MALSLSSYMSELLAESNYEPSRLCLVHDNARLPCESLVNRNRRNLGLPLSQELTVITWTSHAKKSRWDLLIRQTSDPELTRPAMTSTANSTSGQNLTSRLARFTRQNSDSLLMKPRRPALSPKPPKYSFSLSPRDKREYKREKLLFSSGRNIDGIRESNSSFPSRVGTRVTPGDCDDFLPKPKPSIDSNILKPRRHSASAGQSVLRPSYEEICTSKATSKLVYPDRHVVSRWGDVPSTRKFLDSQSEHGPGICRKSGSRYELMKKQYSDSQLLKPQRHPPTPTRKGAKGSVFRTHGGICRSHLDDDNETCLGPISSLPQLPLSTDSMNEDPSSRHLNPRDTCELFTRQCSDSKLVMAARPPLSPKKKASTTNKEEMLSEKKSMSPAHDGQVENANSSVTIPIQSATSEESFDESCQVYDEHISLPENDLLENISFGSDPSSLAVKGHASDSVLLFPSRSFLSPMIEINAEDELSEGEDPESFEKCKICSLSDIEGSSELTTGRDKGSCASLPELVEQYHPSSALSSDDECPSGEQGENALCCSVLNNTVIPLQDRPNTCVEALTIGGADRVKPLRCDCNESEVTLISNEGEEDEKFPVKFLAQCNDSLVIIRDSGIGMNLRDHFLGQTSDSTLISVKVATDKTELESSLLFKDRSKST